MARIGGQTTPQPSTQRRMTSLSWNWSSRPERHAAEVGKRAMGCAFAEVVFVAASFHAGCAFIAVL
jgi:hypothetical protein